MAISIKFTKFDNTPWGFRLAGGSDFPQPLTVIRVTEGSLAECMGLKVGDVVVRLNDQPISSLTHGQAHEELMRAGNNFVLGVLRQEDFVKAAEALSEENIVPYKIPLADLPPVFPEQILKEETVIERHEYEIKTCEEEEGSKQEVEPLPDKPKDANSEIVPNQNLTDDEIAQLILEEEELLDDKGVLGVNFKKLRPRVTVLKQSKVIEELQNIATAEPPLVEQLRRTSVFLQKPERPIPTPRKKEGEQEKETESYKVVIKKQKRRSVTDRLLERGLLKPEGGSTPEPFTPEATPSATPEPGYRSDREPESRPESKAESKRSEEESEAERAQAGETVVSALNEVEEKVEEVRAREEEEEEEKEGAKGREEERTTHESVLNEIEKEMANVAAKVDKERIKELVTTEINLEKQLENVQRQLLSLKQLPSEIENHLRIVSEQLQKIMELSGVQNGATVNAEKEEEEEEEERREPEERAKESEEERAEEAEETEEQDVTEYTEDISYSAYSDEHLRIVQPSEDEGEEETETQELEGTLSVKSEEGSRVKKFVVSYETKVLKSPSPAPSHGSFEPDPNLSAKDQVIQELQERVKQRGRKRSQDLWPQAKQVELTLGRRWRCPNDFFNDEMIAEVLSSQAEVIRGRALGVNFKKYEKTNLPNFDHLMNSSVYKMIHKMEKEPKRGIPARPAKVNAAEDIIERVKSPAFSIADDRSTRSVSH
ncbi:PDZ and LIM domain protein [Apis cerana cerana]|uniref:PDZ and LIM domain protein n=1 Tax=Apis cerana cerana TaxID=94128 RepID=A0A2A3EA62_APICC|nr:PDZ and LIM domain protein [Apis cerana cerana]